MNPYLRAAKKNPELRQNAKEKLSERPEHANKPEQVKTKPVPTSIQVPEPEIQVVDVKVVRRAKDEKGRFKGDDLSTPKTNEAWVETET
jgi:hypothetical protein